MDLKDYTCLLNNNARPLTDHESEMFGMLIMLEKQSKTPPPQMTEFLDGLNFYKTLSFPLNHFNEKGILKDVIDEKTCPPINKYVQGFCAMLSERPAVAVMWAYTLWLIWKTTDKPVTLKIWADFFPYGVPSEPQLARAWAIQKVSIKGKLASDNDNNMIDNLNDWPITWKLPKLS